MTTKSDLETAEAERDRLLAALIVDTKKVYNVFEFLP